MPNREESFAKRPFPAEKRFKNYPHQLSGLLGKQYCVHNYGMSDRTAMETGNHPYTKELRFKRSFAFQPDIVLLGEILREIASERSLETIDMYAFTKGHSEYFLPDGIHPNAVGAQIISEYISRIILKSEEERI